MGLLVPYSVLFFVRWRVGPLACDAVWFAVILLTASRICSRLRGVLWFVLLLKLGAQPGCRRTTLQGGLLLEWLDAAAPLVLIPATATEPLPFLPAVFVVFLLVWLPAVEDATVVVA